MQATVNDTRVLQKKARATQELWVEVESDYTALGWAGTWCVDQAGPELTELYLPLPSASWE